MLLQQTAFKLKTSFLKKLKDNSHNVKLKALQVIRYLLVNGAPALKRAFRTRQLSLIIKQHIPLEGTSGAIIQLKSKDQSSKLSELRSTASEVLNLLLETDVSSSASSSSQSSHEPTASVAKGLGSKIETKKEDKSFLSQAANFFTPLSETHKVSRNSRFGTLDGVGKHEIPSDFDPEVKQSLSEGIEPLVSMDTDQEISQKRAIVRVLNDASESASMMRYAPTKTELDQFSRKVAVFESFLSYNQCLNSLKNQAYNGSKRLLFLSENYHAAAELLELGANRQSVESLGSTIKQIKSAVNRLLSSFPVEVQSLPSKPVNNDCDGLFDGLNVDGHESVEQNGFNLIDDDIEDTLIGTDFSSNEPVNEKPHTKNSFDFVDDLLSNL
ncbi:hypothetical protein GEMRC1_003149 [Eukaryota sp. GEM-RC1]